MGLLLTEPVLVVDQVWSWTANDFAVYAPDGREIGHIVTEGALLGRMVAGNRTFTVTDSDGSTAVQIDDVMTMGRDRYELYRPDGTLLARIVKEFSLWGLNLTVETASGGVLDLQGRIFEWDFTVDDGAGPIARISRSYAGLGSFLLDQQRYVVEFADDASDDARRIVLGATVAVDLIRAKEQRRRSSS